MIPVELQGEPDGFCKQVRMPGACFLALVPRPKAREWKGKEYWRRAIPDLRRAYASICSYSALWVSEVTGASSVDHFEPRSLRPDLAYEWANFRYVCSKMNVAKGIRRILDPFRIGADWFVLDFPSLLVKPNPCLPPCQQADVMRTVETLKLNDDDRCVEERLCWVRDFCKGEFGLGHLQRMAPFIAYELKRQAIVDEVGTIMGIPGCTGSDRF